MDIDFMKSYVEDHTEMMLMLMQMEKLPDFSGAYKDVSNDNINPMLNNYDDNVIYENVDVNTPTFMNLNPSAAPFWDSSGQKRNSMVAMREMIFRIAAMQPVHIDPEAVKPPKRKNVKISTDPQSVAARHRRERISERIRILQRLVPGGTKMDTASMLDEAIHYVKFLKNQVQSLESVANRPAAVGIGFPVPMSTGKYYHHQYPSPHNLGDA